MTYMSCFCEQSTQKTVIMTFLAIHGSQSYARSMEAWKTPKKYSHQRNFIGTRVWLPRAFLMRQFMRILCGSLTFALALLGHNTAHHCMTCCTIFLLLLSSPVVDFRGFDTLSTSSSWVECVFWANKYANKRICACTLCMYTAKRVDLL